MSQSGNTDFIHEDESNNTIFTEYAYAGDITELGFECEDCNYEVDPDELNNYYEDQQ